MERRVKAVIFDLDGTLIDSAPDIHAAVNKMLSGEGYGSLDLPTVTSFIGRGLPNLVQQVMEARSIPLQMHTELCAKVLKHYTCLLYTSPSPRDRSLSRMPSSA